MCVNTGILPDTYLFSKNLDQHIVDHIVDHHIDAVDCWLKGVSSDGEWCCHNFESAEPILTTHLEEELSLSKSILSPSPSLLLPPSFRIAAVNASYPPQKYVLDRSDAFARQHGNQRRHKRRAEQLEQKSLMDDDVRSVPSSRSNQSILNRPILNPTPPSTRYTRSPSPTRKLFGILEFATPSIKFRQPGNFIETPAQVKKLKARLMRHSDFIPAGFKKRIAQDAPYELDEIPDSAFCYNDVMTEATLEELWRKIKEIYTQAADCHRLQMDENEWIEIVRTCFRVAGIQPVGGMLKLISVQTQQIDPVFLPTLVTSQISFAKKADLALVFSPTHDAISTAIEPVLRASPQSTVSHLTDAYSSRVPIGCGIEVKQASGDATEALLQLGIWSAAALAKIASQGLSFDDMKPLVGWRVVGHEWQLYISWIQGDSVVVLGPWNSINAGTGSFEAIFKLLSLIKEVNDWLTGEYWDWYRSTVLNN